MRELRYNPLTGQWIMVSSIRKERRWRPANYCPFCPGTEETGYGWDVLVLSNKFPALSFEAERVYSLDEVYRKAQAIGDCGVIVETPEHNVKDLDELPLQQVYKVVKTWKDLTEKYMRSNKISYLMIFRNKGEEIGVSLTHPHSQYYAMPFIPLRERLMMKNSLDFMRRYGKCLGCAILENEMKYKERLVYQNKHIIAFLPYFASWPFETHIYPRRHVNYVNQLSDEELLYLADALRAVLGTLNSVLDRQMPYSFAVIQAPLKGDYNYFHMHIEIYPILRDKDKLKYAAGIEMSTWDFTYDGVPEENAKRLKDACKKSHNIIKPLGECA